jgi:hypothetical protein
MHISCYKSCGLAGLVLFQVYLHANIMWSVFPVKPRANNFCLTSQYLISCLQKGGVPLISPLTPYFAISKHLLLLHNVYESIGNNLIAGKKCFTLTLLFSSRLTDIYTSPCRLLRSQREAKLNMSLTRKPDWLRSMFFFQSCLHLNHHFLCQGLYWLTSNVSTCAMNSNHPPSYCTFVTVLHNNLSFLLSVSLIKWVYFAFFLASYCNFLIVLPHDRLIESCTHRLCTLTIMVSFRGLCVKTTTQWMFWS